MGPFARAFIVSGIILGSLTAYGQSLVDVLRPFQGLEGRGQVILDGKEKSHVGNCALDVKNRQDSSGSYNSISIKFSTSSTEYILDNYIETARRKGDVMTFSMSPTGDYSGDICGSFAPAKKVYRALIVSPGRLEIQRNYRCPYFITSSTDSWICHF